METLSVLPKKLLMPHQKPPKGHEKKASILLLSNILIFEIYTYLPIVDQACLALTCQRIQLLVGSNRHKEFKFPRLLKIKNPRLCVNKPDVPRNQLLLRLETHDWLYCGACLRLHPREAFSELSPAPLQRRCRANAGILDLCPCLSLTAGDRQIIIRILKNSNPSTGLKELLGSLICRSTPHALTTRLNSRFNLQKTGDITELTHYCSHKAKFWKTRIKLKILIADKELVARAIYILDSQESKRRNFLAEPVFACPHIDITMMAGYLKGEKKCTECKTLIEGISARDENPAIIRTQRELGGIAESECNTWFRQSRFTNEAYGLYNIYWRDTVSIIQERDKKRAEVKKQLRSKELLKRYLQSKVSSPVLTRARSLPAKLAPEGLNRPRP
ncbi:unnamed protein product [Penicillium bialowiezense]